MKQRIAQLTGGALLTALLLSGASSAFAQTYDTTGTTGAAGVTTGTGTTNTSGTVTGSSTTGTSSTTPGIPNTGAGGDTVANIALLTTSGIVVLGGVAYLLRRKNAFE